MFVLINCASAELLLTANSLGQGRFGIKSSYINGSNSLNNVMNTTGYDILLGYGIISNLDIYGVAGYVAYPNAGSTISNLSINGPLYGLILKYRILEDTEYAPFNLSSMVSFKVNNITSRYGNSAYNTMMEDWGGGVVLSKTFPVVTPYIAALYHFGSWIDSYGALRLTSVELVNGYNFMFSESTGLIVEVASNSVAAQGGTSFSITNISLALGQRL
jgi:hypothetical protein